MYWDFKYSTLCRWKILFYFHPLLPQNKPGLLGIFPFSLTCLLCKYSFSLSESECVWWWVNRNPDGQGLKYNDISILLHKKPNIWQSLDSSGSLTMSPRIQGLFTPYSVFSAGWLLFSHLVLPDHETVSIGANITVSPRLLRGREGKKHFLLMCISLIGKDNLSQKPRGGGGGGWGFPLLLARTGQLANSACKKTGCHDLVKIPIPAIDQGSRQEIPAHTGGGGIGNIEGELSVITQIERYYWHLVGWSWDAECPKIHRTLFLMFIHFKRGAQRDKEG